MARSVAVSHAEAQVSALHRCNGSRKILSSCLGSTAPKHTSERHSRNAKHSSAPPGASFPALFLVLRLEMKCRCRCYSSQCLTARQLRRSFAEQNKRAQLHSSSRLRTLGCRRWESDDRDSQPQPKQTAVDRAKGNNQPCKKRSQSSWKSGM